MGYEVTEIADGKIVEVHVSGKLEKEAYEAFVPQTEALIQQHGKLRLVVVLADFHGWDMGALWEDMKFDLKHFRDIEKLAIVGESKWEKGMTMFCKPFTTAEIKWFTHDELETAREWIKV